MRVVAALLCGTLMLTGQVRTHSNPTPFKHEVFENGDSPTIVSLPVPTILLASEPWFPLFDCCHDDLAVEILEQRSEYVTIIQIW